MSKLPVNDYSDPKESLPESDVGVPMYVYENLSQLHTTITQLYDLPTDPFIVEKDFVATPSYYIKPKPVEEYE